MPLLAQSQHVIFWRMRGGQIDSYIAHVYRVGCPITLKTHPPEEAWAVACSPGPL